MGNQQFEVFSYTAEGYLREVERAHDEYKIAANPRLRDALFLVHALHHLREWIAPGRKDEIDKANREKREVPTPSGLAQIFFDSTFDLPDFKLITDLSNGAKHHKYKKTDSSTEFSDMICDWDSLADVESLAKGAPQQQLIDGKPAKDVFETLVHQYRIWFSGDFEA